MNEPETHHTTYAAGYIQCWLDIFAISHGVSAHNLTNRVGQLLSAQEGGSVLGVIDKVPTMRRDTAFGDVRVSEMEVVGGTSSHGTSRKNGTQRRKGSKGKGRMKGRIQMAYLPSKQSKYGPAVIAAITTLGGGPVPIGAVIKRVVENHPDIPRNSIYTTVAVLKKHRQITKKKQLITLNQRQQPQPEQSVAA